MVTTVQHLNKFHNVSIYSEHTVMQLCQCISMMKAFLKIPHYFPSFSQKKT